MKQTIHRSIIMFSVVAQAMLATAENTVIIDRIRNSSLPLYSVETAGYLTNPATSFFSDSTSISSISMRARLNDESQPVMEQTGTGSRLFSINADSYQRLSADMAVWGSASYTTGVYKDIKWTNCIDYEYVAPYVLGDEVGGDLNTQSYRFAGGIARRHDRWTFGAHLSYRAEIASRDHDPRVKTVVSFLNAAIGAAFNVTPRYMVGLNGKVSVYNQNCDVDFYNPINDINIYTLTGMGTYYKRFMGNANKNSGYNSVGFSASAQFLSTDKSGLKAAVSFDSYRMKQQLRNFNNLTLGFTDNTILTGSAAYRFTPSGSIIVEPVLTACARFRKGTENIFGTSAGASYDKIGSNSYYRHNSFLAEISVPVQWSINSNLCLTSMPGFSIFHDKESYADPMRKTCVTRFTPGLRENLSLTRGAWLWSIDASGAYRLSDSDDPVWTDLDLTSPLGKCQLHNYAMLSADCIEATVDFSAARSIGKTAIKGTIFYSINHYLRHGDNSLAGITLGIYF